MAPKYHPKIIGRKGAVIGKIRIKHEVNIQFPARNQEEQDTIKIMGYEANAEAAKEEILAIVKELVSTVVGQVTSILLEITWLLAYIYLTDLWEVTNFCL